MKNKLTAYRVSLVALLSLSAPFAMEQQFEEDQVYFNDLPVELKQHICSYLPAKDLANVAFVDRVLNAIANDDNLWQALCEEANFGQKPEEMTWKNFYGEKITTKKIRLSVLFPDNSFWQGFGNVIINVNNKDSFSCRRSQVNNSYRLVLTEDYEIKKSDLRDGIKYSYTVETNAVRPLNSPEGPIIYYVKDKDVSQLSEFGKKAYENFNNLESIRLNLMEGADYGYIELGISTPKKTN